MRLIPIIRLARLCGRFEQAFEPSGADIRVVRAVEWQTAILGRFGGKTRAGLKLAAVAWAKGTFGVSLPSDAADAAGVDRKTFAERLARTKGGQKP